MQYGIDIAAYSRVSGKGTEKKIKTVKKPIGYVILAMVGFMLSRVMISVTPGAGIAPFGMAYLLSVVRKNKKSEVVVAFLSILMGYFSVLNRAEDIIIYATSLVSVLIYWAIIGRNRTKDSTWVNFIIIYLTFTISSFLFGEGDFTVILALSMVKVLSVIPVYYILVHAINCVEELKTNYLFNTEELISMAILVCLIIAGVGNYSIMGVSIRNVLAFAVVIAISYICGGGIGAATGATMGFIIGITGNNMMTLISLYSLSGLIVGVFKETGKILSIIAYIVVYFIVAVYSEQISMVASMEAVLGAALVILIPAKLFEKARLEINSDKKSGIIEGIQMERAREEFVERLNGLKSIFSSLSISISDLSENDKLLLKGKGAALVENLADRVCSTCEYKNKCWNRDLHSTFSQFTELIRSCEDGNCQMSSELDKKCFKRSKLMKSAGEVVQNHNINEAMRTRLMEGRKLIVEHLNNMSLTMGQMITDFDKDISICVEIDRLLRKAFNKENIKYNDVFCYTDIKGRLKIKLTLQNCSGCNYCAKNILPVINKMVKVPVSISESGCKINPDTGECSIIIEETPKYHISTYGNMLAKDGEDYSGDSFIFNKNEDGTYLVALSDGMGSGPEASAESKVTVELLERFLQAGFNEDTAINTINTIMAMKFSEDEKFTTLDLSLVDLYTGEADFIKIGGVVSFIKRGEDVKIVRGQSLPFGVLDSVEPDHVNEKLKHGDIIVTISDGVLDVDKNNVGSYYWLEEFLQDSNTNPEILSREILDKAKGLSRGRVWDDMTVVVSKIYSVY